MLVYRAEFLERDSVHSSFFFPCVKNIRDFKMPRRRRQQERQKAIG